MAFPTLPPPPAKPNRRGMGVFKNIFTWWEGATFGTWLGTRVRGNEIGKDSLGNVYFEGGEHPDGRKRRWVMYAGANDPSRVPPEWYGWLLGQIDGVPDDTLPRPKPWIAPPTPNFTGSPQAYRPAGALEKGGKRAAATGDYQAWSPGEA